MSGCSSGACPFEQCVIGTDPDSGGMFPDHRDFVLWISAWGQLSAAADSDFLSFQDPICHSASGWTFRKTGVCGSGGLWNFVYYTLLYVKQNAGILTNDASMDITQKYVQIMKSLIFNRLMLAMIAASLVSVIVVYLIRRLSVDYAWIIAIVAGAVAQLAVVFIGDFVFDVSVPILQLLIGTLVSMAIAGIYNFMIFSVDYTRTEYTQFEDDDYYYYVKAVPKMNIAAPDVKVQKINSTKTRRPAVKEENR